MTKKSTILFPPILSLQDAARQQGRSVGDLVRRPVGRRGRPAARRRLAQLDDEVPDDAQQLESEIARGATER